MRQVLLLLAMALFVTDASAKDRKRRRKQKHPYQQEQHCGTPAPPCEPLPPAPAYNGPQAMAEADFRDACSTIEQAKFDDDKMDIARFIAGKNHLTADQICIMAKMLSFDDSRLEFAKYAYASCIDQQNYYKLNGALTFSSNKEELMSYLSKQ